MLVTTCKHCTARFRVTPDQLNARQGQVRCGECGGVFNGFEALERFPGDDTGTRLLAARAAPRTPESASRASTTTPDSPPARHETEPALEHPEGLHPTASREAAGDGDGTRARHWAIVPESEAERPQPVSPPREPPPEFVAPLEHAHAPAAPRGSPETATRLSDFTINVPEPTEPPRPSRAWSFAAVLLGLLLGLQVTYAFRSEIANRYPPARPVLESACAAAGCTVPWINQEGALKLEDSELLEVPGKAGQIALAARIRSLAGSPMEYPHLELTLTDTTGQTAVRRVIRPVDYLGRAPVPGDVLAPGADLLVSLRLETGRMKATGYELLLFYP